MTENAPDRVRRRLDREPAAADEWEWTCSGDTWSVLAGGETVTLNTRCGVIASADDMACSCLLSPRCYHLLSCLAVLDVASAEESAERSATADRSTADRSPTDRASAMPAAGGSHAAGAGPEAVELDDRQQAAARRMFVEAANLIAVGARSAGALIQAQLLRALHECRSLGLHRLSAGALRVVQRIRELRNSVDHFDSSVLVSDLAETLELAWRLTTSRECSSDWIGTARRPYFPIESLSLQGLFTQPVVTASGYSGVVTWLMDQRGELYSVSNVRPGEPSRVFDALHNGIDLGGLSVTHRELSRSGLLVQRGTASRDGRLGSGQDCRAVSKTGDGWSAPAVERAFATSFEQQIARVFAATSQSLITRRSGWDLVFLRGTVLGTDGQSVVFQIGEDRAVKLSPASKLDLLADRANAIMLARCPGLALRVIARLDLSRSGCLFPLAVAPDQTEVAPEPADASSGITRPGIPQLQLPATYRGHLGFGLEKLERAHFTTAEREPVHLPVATIPAPDDGLSVLTRQIRELALYGRHSLPTRRIGPLARASSALHDQGRPTAAMLLRNLASAAIDSQTMVTGQRFPSDPAPLARIWLACTCYASAGTLEFQRSQWLATDAIADPAE